MLKIEDRLKVKRNSYFNDNDACVLDMLYLPLIGEKAYVLYRTLISLKIQKAEFTTHKILVKLTGYSIEAIEEARIVLEKFNLVKTFYHRLDDTYLLIILSPMIAEDFLAHEVYGRMYINKLGKDTVKYISDIFISKHEDYDGFVDMSQSMTNLVKDNWDESDEAVFAKVKKQTDAAKQAIEIIFDYDKFLKNYDTVWPKRFRSKANLEKIGTLATIYGVSEKAMRRLVSIALNPVNYQLDIDKLKALAAKSRSGYETNNDNKYQWPPRRFLESKQPGTPISSHDMEIIRMLMEDYRFNAEVTNVLLEYVLNNSDNKLVRKYIESIAASWSRSNIDTYDKAVARIKGESIDTIKLETQNEPQENAKILSKTEREALIKSLQGGKNAKG